ncbi:putative ribonuclease H protein [Platanthera guangdongensis]|uniref:Ribonuclease H protein n=1 Tax=Platanthera guangdongensis TaxID=2320717 RepID=A0ABR2MM00_9ASPA
MRSLFRGSSIITWKSIWQTGIRVIVPASCVTRVSVKCFSARRSCILPSSTAKLKSGMAEECDAFYVVRKGDMVGIYKRLSDCQAQVSSSVCDPSVSVYKGYSLPKEAEVYLASRGLKDALYTMHASYLKDDLFGTLAPCPFQQPDGLAFLVDKAPKRSSSRKRLEVVSVGIASSSDMPTAPTNKLLRMTPNFDAHPLSMQMTCVLEFDGASKGNPGQAGAGAVIRTEDGNVVSRVREGLGIATNNVAEYRGLILGMKYALMRGFKHIRVQGDSQLVCMQLQDIWQTKNQNMADLCKEAKRLKDMFLSFNITHVRREFNAFADNLANLAVSLPVGEVCEDCGPLS